MRKPNQRESQMREVENTKFLTICNRTPIRTPRYMPLFGYKKNQ